METAAAGRGTLLDLLVEKKMITPKQADEAIVEQQKTSTRMEEVLVSLNQVKEDAIAQVYADYMSLPLLKEGDVPFVNLGESLGPSIPERLARESRVVPLSKQGEVLKVGLLDPTDVMLLQELQLQTGLKINVCVMTLGAVKKALDTIYGERDSAKEVASDMKGQESESTSEESDEGVLDLGQFIPESRETQIVRLVNRIMDTAIKERTSDIHIEPYPEELKIRYRIDGVLQDISPPPKSMYVPLISRLKVLCKMDIAEKRIPQDGAFSVKRGDYTVDCRVSTVPTIYGEKMVIRILSKSADQMDLANLGFNPRQYEDFIAGAKSPHGLVYVTGPTGSGKSTTLYATLNLLRTPRKNVLTVEDPVEYKMVGINQVQIKSQVGLTWSATLRAFLRQDPDIIMVGETRDAETAEISLRAALTGHLVLSTLHTNDAISAVSRLQNMGIDRFLLAATLRLLEAQRLVRRLCPACKEAYSLDEETAPKYGLTKDDVIYKPKGCAECRNLGYRGRVGVYEIVRVTGAIRDAMQANATLSENPGGGPEGRVPGPLREFTREGEAGPDFPGRGLERHPGRKGLTMPPEWLLNAAKVKEKKHPKISIEDILAFFQQLSTLLNAGTPLLHAVNAHRRQRRVVHIEHPQ